jgi:hypothetical protein
VLNGGNFPEPSDDRRSSSAAPGLQWDGEQHGAVDAPRPQRDGEQRGASIDVPKLRCNGEQGNAPVDAPRPPWNSEQRGTSIDALGPSSQQSGTPIDSPGPFRQLSGMPVDALGPSPQHRGTPVDALGPSPQQRGTPVDTPGPSPQKPLDSPRSRSALPGGRGVRAGRKRSAMEGSPRPTFSPPDSGALQSELHKISPGTCVQVEELVAGSSSHAVYRGAHFEGRYHSGKSENASSQWTQSRGETMQRQMRSLMC